MTGSNRKWLGHLGQISSGVFAERQDLKVERFPALPDLRMSFGVMAKLSFSSFARSSVEAGDKLPVPVFDKSGSAL